MGSKTSELFRDYFGMILELFRVGSQKTKTQCWNYFATIVQIGNDFGTISELCDHFDTLGGGRTGLRALCERFATILELIRNYFGIFRNYLVSRTISELFRNSLRGPPSDWNYFGTISELSRCDLSRLELFLNYF